MGPQEIAFDVVVEHDIGTRVEHITEEATITILNAVGLPYWAIQVGAVLGMSFLLPLVVPFLRGRIRKRGSNKGIDKKTRERKSATERSLPASVYLAYGDEDLPFARRLYEALEAAGVSVFFREDDAVPGAHRHRSARRSIREYEHVVLLCSERSLRAASVLSELDEMLSREFDDGASERIIPVLLDDYVSVGWQPRHPDLRRAVLDRVALDMKGVDRDPAKFTKAMARLLGALRSEPHSPPKVGAAASAPPRASDPAQVTQPHAPDDRRRPIDPGASEPAPVPAQGTRWPTKLSGAEVQELVDALLSAFPSRSALAQVVRVGLDENLDAIAAPGNLRATVFELVGHAEAHGQIPALFDAALAVASGNPDLLALAAKRRG